MVYQGKIVEELLFKSALKFIDVLEARYFAVEHIEAHIRKYPRSNVIEEAIEALENWKGRNSSEINIIKDLPGVLRLDCTGLAPAVKLHWIHQKLSKKAKDNGIAMMSLDNSLGMHTLHLWSQGLAKENLFVIGGFNGGPLAVVPYNGTQGLLGTNPLTYAFPIKNDVLVVDMATSEIPYFEIINAQKQNTRLKENVAVNFEGKPTTDPNQALTSNGVSNLLPIGGNYKGYIINYLMEIATGSLIGAKLSNIQNPNFDVKDHGGFLIAIDISAFTNIDSFKEETEGLNKIIRSQKSVESKKVIVPGDFNHEKLLRFRESNLIELDEGLFNKLEILSAGV